MKLIIDIDENIYKARQHWVTNPKRMVDNVDVAIANGIPLDVVLDRIRVELHATAELHDDGDCYLRDEWIDEYFDKYKAESEDKR